MSHLRTYAVATVAAGLLVACSGSSGSDNNGASGNKPVAIEDERGSVGVPPTAGEYCVMLGYTLSGSDCQFPDGTSCEEWAFYRGQCGQPHSYCNQHGGTIASKTVNMGTWTAIYGVCTVNGAQCDEGIFVQSTKCP
jgi:putative hemolysin